MTVELYCSVYCHFIAKEGNGSDRCDCSCLLCLEQFLTASIDFYWSTFCSCSSKLIQPTCSSVDIFIVLYAIVLIEHCLINPLTVDIINILLSCYKQVRLVQGPGLLLLDVDRQLSSYSEIDTIWQSIYGLNWVFWGVKVWIWLILHGIHAVNFHFRCKISRQYI